MFEFKAGTDAVFTVADVTGFDVATAPRTVATQVGVLVSARVPEGDDVVFGDCRLPAGRSVLVQRDVAAP